MSYRTLLQDLLRKIISCWGEVAVQLGRGPAQAAVRQPLHSRLSLGNSAGSAAPPPGIVLPGPTSWRAAQVFVGGVLCFDVMTSERSSSV